MLARSDCSLSRATAARSMLLPYLFNAALNFSSSPFDLGLPSSVAFSRSPGYARRPKPVAVFQAQSSQTSIQLPLPFRTFILPDRSAQSVARSEKLTFVSGPFSLRSPQAPIIFNNYPLTDHRSRFATVYQAYCSLNLLEPCPCCPETLCESIMKCWLQSVFQSFYFAWIQEFSGVRL